MNKKTIGILILVGVIFVILIGLTVYLVQQQQDVRSHASTPDTTFTAPNSLATPTVGVASNVNLAAASNATDTPAACTVPASVTNVQIEYPYTDSTNTVFYAEANCTWSASTGVDSYSVKVTDIDTSVVVSTQTVNSSITNLVFSVTPGSKYRCEVSGTNSCGTGPVGSAEATCSVDGLQPTASTSATIIPTATPILAVATPTPIPAPNALPNTGSVGTTVTIGVIGTLLVLTGGALLFGL